LENEEKNLILVKTDKKGEILMPCIDDLLKLDTSLNHVKRSNVSKKGFMDTKVIDAYHDI